MAYPLGFPGWRLVANFGLPISIGIDICKDDEAGVYFATSDQIGLAVESESLDGLMKEIHLAVPVLLEHLHPVSNPRPDIRIHEHFVPA